ncbi:MAG: carbohydrate ABC transporter permease [Eubacteriales bacterium]
MQNTAVKGAPAVKKRKGRSLDKVKSRSGYLFTLPFILGFLVIYIPVVIDSLRFSFNEIKIQPGGGYNLIFVGLDNYMEALFENPNFVRQLTSGVTQLIFDIPSIVIFALFVAILLNQKMAGRGVFRAIFFIPVIISTGIMQRIEAGNEMLSYMGNNEAINTGSTTQQSQVTEIISALDIQRLFMNMKIGSDMAQYVLTFVNNIYNIVNRSGVQMLIFLAGLQSIAPSIYESAFMEGASSWETFWKITFPMISPMILVNAIYTVIDSFTNSQNPVMALIETTYEEAGGNVVSSAMAWMYFLVVILIIAAVAGILSAYVFYQRRD